MEEVESYLMRALGSALTVPVYTDIPATRPAEFVTVERVAGGRSDCIDHPTVDIRTYSTTRAKARGIAASVMSAVSALETGDVITKAEMDTYYHLAPEDGTQSYVVTYDMTAHI